MNYEVANFNTVLEMVNKLQATNSNKDKLTILKSYIGHEDEELIKKVLNYTYSPFKKYGISESVYDEISVVNNTIFKCPFEMLDKLAESNINDLLRLSTKAFIENEVDESYRELFKGILFKDLKLGVNAKSINKVWKGLVPEFNVQLAESLTKAKDAINPNDTYYLTTKLDGFRILAVPNENKSYTFYTRKGEEYEGLDHLQEECQRIGKGTLVLDGELIARNDDNLSSGDLYKVTTKIARKKGKTPEKAKLQFNVFDIVQAEEFKKGGDMHHYSSRREYLNKVFEQENFNKPLENLVLVPTLLEFKGSDLDRALAIIKDITAQGGEGGMINKGTSPYWCKRHKGILKVKDFKDADVWVTDVYEGTGRNKGRLGGVVIQYLYNGELQECECGSGFTDEQRIEFWNKPDSIIGHVTEIQYFEVTTNDKGGFGLRFPTFKNRMRDDKGFEDITDVALQ